MTQHNRGFTLVEILVVITIFVVLLMVVNEIFFSILKGSSKSDVTGKVKREGEAAIAVMDRELRNSKTLSCSGDNRSVTYLSSIGVLTTFACVNLGSADGKITKGGLDLTSNDTTVTSCSFACQSINGVTKVVLINLSISEKANSSSRVQEKAKTDLQTRVVIRN